MQNLTKPKTDRNGVITNFKYDGLNRLVEKSNTKDGTNTAVKITYDSLGNVTQKIDASGTTSFEHDTLGRITAINYGNGIRQNYSYNSADQVTAFELYQGGSKEIDLTYQYDNVGRLTTVRNSGKPFDYKYDAAGKLIEEIDGVTGIKSTYSYYPSGSLRSLRHFRGQELIDFYDYKYDKRGNQTEVAEQKGVTSYYYDSLSRIKTVLSPDDAIQNYEYDDLNNIKELVEIRGNNITETKYTYDKNSRLLLQETDNGSEVTQKRFTYDLAGNQTTKDEVIKRNGSLVAATHLDYYYDGANQLSRVTNDEGLFVEYTYNAEGLRTRKNFGDEATNFVYNNGYIVLETNQDNRITAKNIWGSQLIAREIETDEYHYLYNGHGDVASLLNEKGETVKDHGYDIYGNAEVDPVLAFNGQLNVEQWRQETEKIDNPFRYCGEYLDEETGNYYLRARYYDPSIQRFVNEDSSGVKYGPSWEQHLYGYANNNPVRYIDTTGFSYAEKKAGVKSQAVFFVHGLGGNEGTFGKMIADFEENGYGTKVTARVRIVNGTGVVKLYNAKEAKQNGGRVLVQVVFEDNDSPVEWQALWLNRTVNKVKSTFGGIKQVDLVGHSAGGLTSRLLATDYNHKIGRLVTIATPHLGADMAALAPGKGNSRWAGLLEDLEGGSRIIRYLNSKKAISKLLKKGIDMYAIAGEFRSPGDLSYYPGFEDYVDDGIVSRDNALRLPGAKTKSFSGFHMGICAKSPVINYVKKILFGG